MDKLFYYKTQDNSGWFCLKSKSKDESLIELTKEQWDAHIASINNRQPSQKSLINKQIRELKSKLAASDYQAIKYAEGWISESEYSSIKSQRQAIRDQINALEAQLASL